MLCWTARCARKRPYTRMAVMHSSSTSPTFPTDLRITTTEMHTGGEPLRIIESGYPQPKGATILEKRAWLRSHADSYRRLVMSEPRGHNDMFGALLVPADLPEADLAVIFIQNEGYSTMCGHAIIALGRYAVDRGLVPGVCPETSVIIQCPCRPVTASVTYRDHVTSDVRFTSVPSYVFALDVEVEVVVYQGRIDPYADADGMSGMYDVTGNDVTGNDVKGRHPGSDITGSDLSPEVTSQEVTSPGNDVNDLMPEGVVTSWTTCRSMLKGPSPPRN